MQQIALAGDERLRVCLLWHADALPRLPRDHAVEPEAVDVGLVLLFGLSARAAGALRVFGDVSDTVARVAAVADTQVTQFGYYCLSIAENRPVVVHREVPRLSRGVLPLMLVPLCVTKHTLVEKGHGTARDDAGANVEAGLTLDAAADVVGHLVQPVGLEVRALLVKGADAVGVLGELGDALHMNGVVHELRHPFGVALAPSELQLDLNDGIREVDVVIRRRRVRVAPVVDARTLAAQDHVCVHGHTHGGGVGELEGRAGVAGSQHGLKVVCVEFARNVVDEVREVSDFALFSTFLLQVVDRALDVPLTANEWHDVLLCDGEALLRRRLPQPGLVVHLALHEDVLVFVAVPANAD
eukprot:PhM_4_TR18600/c0_g1_i1/m.30878